MNKAISYTIAYWRTCFPFHTSPIKHCGAYHNRHKPYWNRIPTTNSRKRSVSVSEGFFFSAVSFPLRRLGRCCGAFPFAGRSS